MRVVMTLLVVTQAATAAPVFEAPTGKDPVPLVVVLHGDREHAAAAAARWRAAVKRRGWALLALECPHELACRDSFRQRDGDTSWVRAQVAAVAAERAIDGKRVFLVGWSGGGSYIGRRAQAWAPTFAAIVIHGGGIPPADAACGDPLPVYFLVGDHNPLHHLAKALRAYFDGCKQTVEWDVIAGADHAGEAAALTAKQADAILAWLAAAPRV